MRSLNLRSTYEDLLGEQMDVTESMAKTAFNVCDYAKPDGLTWNEVQDCEVRFYYLSLIN